jgi:hypothetical protein
MNSLNEDVFQIHNFKYGNSLMSLEWIDFILGEISGMYNLPSPIANLPLPILFNIPDLTKL